MPALAGGILCDRVRGLIVKSAEHCGADYKP